MAKRQLHTTPGTKTPEPKQRDLSISQVTGLSLGDEVSSRQMIERLRWQLDRAEAWVTNADSKATVLLGMNGALIAGVLTVDPEVVAGFLKQGLIAQGLAALFGTGVVCSSVEAARAVLPNLGKPKSGGSIFHFGDVDGMALDGFSALSREMTPLLEIQGMEHQVFTVSRIASTKFRRLRRSVCALIVVLTLGFGIVLTHHLG